MKNTMKIASYFFLDHLKKFVEFACMSNVLEAYFIQARGESATDPSVYDMGFRLANGKVATLAMNQDGTWDLSNGKMVVKSFTANEYEIMRPFASPYVEDFIERVNEIIDLTNSGNSRDVGQQVKAAVRILAYESRKLFTSGMISKMNPSVMKGKAVGITVGEETDESRYKAYVIAVKSCETKDIITFPISIGVN